MGCARCVMLADHAGVTAPQWESLGQRARIVLAFVESKDFASWVGGTNDGHQFARQVGVDPYGRYPVEPEGAIIAGLTAGPEVMPVGPAKMGRHSVPGTVAGGAGVLGSGETESGAEANPSRHDDGLGPASRPPRRSR